MLVFVLFLLFLLLWSLVIVDYCWLLLVVVSFVGCCFWSCLCVVVVVCTGGNTQDGSIFLLNFNLAKFQFSEFLKK